MCLYIIVHEQTWKAREFCLSFNRYSDDNNFYIENRLSKQLKHKEKLKKVSFFTHNYLACVKCTENIKLLRCGKNLQMDIKHVLRTVVIKCYLNFFIFVKHLWYVNSIKPRRIRRWLNIYLMWRRQYLEKLIKAKRRKIDKEV